MWGNGNDRENRHPLPARKLIRAVVEKDPIGAGRLVLGVGFPQALAVHPDQRSVFVGVQAGMPRIRFEETERLQDLLVQTTFRRVGSKRVQLTGGLIRKSQLTLHKIQTSSACAANEPRCLIRPAAESARPRFTEASASLFSKSHVSWTGTAFTGSSTIWPRRLQ